MNSFTTIDDLLDAAPLLRERFLAFCERLWRGDLIDPVVLELCRLRIAQLHRCDREGRVRYAPAAEAGLGDDLVGNLAQWAQAPAFDPAHRAALAFAEQFVVDARGVTDQDVERLLEHFTAPEVVALAAGVAVIDGLDRLRATMGVADPDPAAATAMVVAAPSSAGIEGRGSR